MMFKLPSTATTSASIRSLMILGKTEKWMNDGGRVRTRQAVWLPSADQVIAELAVGAFDRGVNFVVRRVDPAVGHDQLEVLDQAFHAVVGRQLVGQRKLLGDRHVHRARRAACLSAWVRIRWLWRISSIRTMNRAQESPSTVYGTSKSSSG